MESENTHYRIMKILIESKVIDIYNNHDYVLQYASANGHYDIVKLLIKKGYNFNNDKALLYAADYGHYNIVRLLIENGVNVHAIYD